MVPAILVGIAAVVAVLVITTDGPIYSADGAAYLGVAQNLRDGRGPTVPFDLVSDLFSPAEVVEFDGAVPSTGFPPLYPALIATVGIVGQTSVDHAARVLGALVAGVNAVLFAAVARRCLRSRSWPLAAAAAALLTANVWWALSQALVLSEALFVVWVFGAALVAPRLLRAPTAATLAGAALLGVAAVLTRHVGLSVPGALALMCLAHPAWPWPARLRRAIAVAAPSVLATAAWSAFGAIAGGEGSGAGVPAFHAPPRIVGSSIDLVSAWLFGPDLRGAGLLLLGFAVVLGGGAWAARHVLAGDAAAPPPERPRDFEVDRRATLQFLALHTALYVAGVYFARVFLDVTLPITNAHNFLSLFATGRLFLPALPALLCLVLVALEPIGDAIARATGLRRGGGPLVAGALLVVVLGGFTVYPWTQDYVDDFVRPMGFDRSAVLGALDRLEPSALIASNRPDLVWLGARRASVKYPQQTVWLTDEPNDDYDRHLAELARLLCRRGGVIVTYLPPPLGAGAVESLRAHAELRQVAAFDDGTLYAVAALDGDDRPCREPTPFSLAGDGS
jgi:hypothetical protein